MANGTHPLVEKTFNSLQQKHPKSEPAYGETLINGDPSVIHPIIFDDISEELVTKMAIRTKYGSSPSGLDPDKWRKNLTLKVFGSCSPDLCEVITDFIKHIFINEIEFQNNTTSLETDIASRLVPLDQNPGLPSIGVGEVLQRIASHEYSERCNKGSREFTVMWCARCRM